MKERIFIDGVESLRVSSGMVRMEIYTESKPENRQTPPGHDVFGEIIVSTAGFVNTFSAMEKLMHNMIEAGIVKRAPAPDAPKTQAPDTEDASPNFN